VNRTLFIIINVIMGLLKAIILASVVVWVLPLWGIHLPLWALILIVAAFLSYEIITFRLCRKALERKPANWNSTMIGCYGKAKTELAPHGYVRVGGELWRASSHEADIDEGEEVVVVGLDKLNLYVAPLQTSEYSE
jgi:membrane-bound ClpP family serine protease